MSPQANVLITGCKTGIGKGLLAAYALRPNTTAIAAIRDGPASSSASDIASLPTGPGSKIIVVEYDASSRSAATEMVTNLGKEHLIKDLDVVVANAGILKGFGATKDALPEDIMEHLTINTLAPILLYQACAPLLNESKQEPKFFVISSSLGSNTLMDGFPMPLVAYGMSKAAINFAVGKMHREEKRMVVVPVQPGWVQTAMGERAASIVGMEAKDVPVTLEASVNGLLGVFDAATKGTHSGKFWDQNNDMVPW
jgi:norsolorinic acid ketoreductase